MRTEKTKAIVTWVHMKTAMKSRTHYPKPNWPMSRSMCSYLAGSFNSAKTKLSKCYIFAQCYNIFAIISLNNTIAIDLS